MSKWLIHINTKMIRNILPLTTINCVYGCHYNSIYCTNTWKQSTLTGDKACKKKKNNRKQIKWCMFYPQPCECSCWGSRCSSAHSTFIRGCWTPNQKKPNQHQFYSTYIGSNNTVKLYLSRLLYNQSSWTLIFRSKLKLPPESRTWPKF